MPTTSHIAERTNVFDKIELLEEHAHSKSEVYPTLDDGVLVESDAASWTLGNFVEIIPANVISEDFDIHWINIEAATAEDIYELVLYAEETEIGRIRFTITLAVGNKTVLPPMYFQSVVLKANSQVQAKLASATGGSDATISVFYHTY